MNKSIILMFTILYSCTSDISAEDSENAYIKVSKYKAINKFGNYTKSTLRSISILDSNLNFLESLNFNKKGERTFRKRYHYSNQKLLKTIQYKKDNSVLFVVKYSYEKNILKKEVTYNSRGDFFGSISYLYNNNKKLKTKVTRNEHTGFEKTTYKYHNDKLIEERNYSKNDTHTSTKEYTNWKNNKRTISVFAITNNYKTLKYLYIKNKENLEIEFIEYLFDGKIKYRSEKYYDQFSNLTEAKFYQSENGTKLSYQYSVENTYNENNFLIKSVSSLDNIPDVITERKLLN